MIRYIYIYIYIGGVDGLIDSERVEERERERGALGVMDIVIGNGHANLSSYPGLGSLDSANTLRTGMRLTILPLAMDK